ncbi:MAG: Uma2 family endonuclease [Acidobacteriota bacterium]
MSTAELVDSQIAFSPLLRHYTLGEFWELPEPPDRWHYDLIGGVLYMVPPPDPPHGDLDSRLNHSLILFLEANGNKGRVYHPREAIYIDSTNVEPDMMYVSSELASRMGRRRTSADIVFEYLSKSTAVYDRTTKADTYLALGVRELWLIDPTTRTIEVRHWTAPATDGGLPRWEVVGYRAGESAESRVLTGWSVSVDRLFADLV